MVDKTLWPLLPGLMLLAVHPAIWLVGTWLDPAYGSNGGLIFVVCISLILLSFHSGPTSHGAVSHLAPVLAMVMAAVRIIGHLLDVEVIGALALVVDIYAVGLALRLAHRPFALSPAALAGLFALSLPLGRIVERAVGYPLQLIAAGGACRALGWFHADVTCMATQLQVDGAAVSIDLPCSGARGLIHFAVVVFTLAALRRLSGGRLLLAMAAAFGLAIAANIVRIVVIAEGLLAGVAVDQEPYHSMIGLLALTIGVIPLLSLAQSAPPVLPSARGFALSLPACPLGLVLFGLAAVVVVLPQKPLDVSGPTEPVALPGIVGQFYRSRLALTDREQAYVGRFGGEIQRARYGPHVVLAVRTSAPIRHLHPPSDCLRGAGHESRLLGVTTVDAVPTAVYRSKAPSGQVYRVEVSYVSAAGTTATSGAEVAWRWLQAPTVAWTMIQRITPFEQCAKAPAACEHFSRSLLKNYVGLSKGKL